MILTLGSGTEVRKNPWELFRGTVLAIALNGKWGNAKQTSLNGPDSSTKNRVAQQLTTERNHLW